MNSPFKLLAGFALVSVVFIGLATWIMSVRPARDELGVIPTAAPESLQPSKPDAAAQKAPGAVNQPAPALQLPGIASGRFSLASYRGKAPVILYFFATW